MIRKKTSSANPYLEASHWQRIIAGSALGLNAEQIAAAADSAARKTREGLVTCAWHEAAAVTGSPCYCVPCVKARVSSADKVSRRQR